MSFNLSDKVAIIGGIPSALVNNTDATTGWINVSAHRNYLVCATIGFIDTTFAMLIRTRDSDNANAADLSGFAVTALGDSDDNKYVELGMNAADLPYGHNQINVKTTIGSGTSGCNHGVLVLADAHYGPASDSDSTSVAEVKNP